MPEIFDPEAEATSLMLKQQTLCDGQKTGRMCHHYHRFVQKVESANPDFLRLGQVGRFCKISEGFPIEMFEQEKRVKCVDYTPRRLPILKAIGVALRIIPDPYAYDGDVEEYAPITPEQQQEIFAKRKTKIADLLPPSPAEQRSTAGFGENIEEFKEEIKGDLENMSAEELAEKMGWAPPPGDDDGDVDDVEPNTEEEGKKDDDGKDD